MLLTVAIFPGAHSVPVYQALEAGHFATAGLDVTVREVTSSSEQLARWDRGALHAVHTSADHFVRGPRPVAARLLRVEPVGELVVHTRPGVAPGEDATSLRWGVDDPDSGFAFVLRAIVEARLGTAPAAASLVTTGGTLQRLEALREGRVDGATLHSPFDVIAARAGLPRLGGHLEVAPDLVTNACFVRADLGVADAYDAALEAGRQDVLRGGPDRAAALLAGRGLAADRATAAARGIFTDLGLPADPRPTRAGLDAVARLRRRFDPGFEPDPVLLDALLAR
ncbi:hypothetical protein DSM104299_04023 [Baekduia alba]|uniref:hypothetical protein n=1 Tax=Baekduia alba TaxID=2997333 RepID=UPI00234230B8|nr:hypothetical protein [Baekduia alba]WCB95280.1 hypothetical protein DSM104299_04023 [Baekduia alba]